MWGIIVALVSIPLCYYYWRRWDRPSRAAKAEMQRRLSERETRKAFAREDAKAREHERIQALSQLNERRQSNIPPPSSEQLTDALTSLNQHNSIDNSSSTNDIVRTEEEISQLESIPETIKVPDIESDDIESEVILDEGPISLKIVGGQLSEDIKPKSEPVSLEDDFEWPEWE